MSAPQQLYAQDEKQEENKPKQEEARPEPKQDEMKAPKQDEAKPPKQEKREEKQGERQSQMSTGHQEPGQQGHARPAGKSAHIPDEKFHAQFGREHKFAAQRPVIVEGQPRFQYGGYSFVLVDVWPTDWAYTDDVYIDYVDGDYFLFDLLHPGERIALFVVM